MSSDLFLSYFIQRSSVTLQTFKISEFLLYEQMSQILLNLNKETLSERTKPIKNVVNYEKVKKGRVS